MRKFPIYTDSACQNKWTWSSIWLNKGETANCHRVQTHHVAIEHFQNFNNTGEKLAQRRLMLNGEWPGQGCEYCKNIEDAGGFSDRMTYTELGEWMPPELETDPTAIEVTPRIVELFFDNMCNLKCLYCTSDLSSEIEKENIKFGEFDNLQGIILRADPIVMPSQIKYVDKFGSTYFVDRHPDAVPTREQYVDQFFIWLENNYRELRNLQLLGGEPFLQKEIDRLITFFESHDAPDLTINIISNLMIKQSLMEKYVDRLAELTSAGKLKNLMISASIDGWGPASVFTRTGLDLEVFESNIKYCLNHPSIRVGLHSVITSLTFKELLPLLKKIVEWRAIDPLISYQFQTNTDTTKMMLQPAVWGDLIWKNDFDEIIKFMTDNNFDHIEYMKGIWKTIESTIPDTIQINNFYQYLNELDRRRGSNWREAYPHLIEDKLDQIIELYLHRHYFAAHIEMKMDNWAKVFPYLNADQLSRIVALHDLEMEKFNV
jgi:organic radical activating enzyme